MLSLSKVRSSKRLRASTSSPTVCASDYVSEKLHESMLIFSRGMIACNVIRPIINSARRWALETVGVSTTKTREHFRALSNWGVSRWKTDLPTETTYRGWLIERVDYNSERERPRTESSSHPVCSVCSAKFLSYFATVLGIQIGLLLLVHIASIPGLPRTRARNRMLVRAYLTWL